MENSLFPAGFELVGTSEIAATAIKKTWIVMPPLVLFLSGFFLTLLVPSFLPNEL